jgi:hypothetical protein
VESEKEFKRALALEPERRAGRRIPRRSHLPQLLLYSDQVRYVEQLRRYHAHFPAEQVLVLIYDDFRADNVGTVRRVLRFLDVDAHADVQPLQTNVTKRTIRSHAADDLVRSVSLGSGPLSRTAKAATKLLTSRRLRHDAIAVARRHLVLAGAPEPDEALMAQLRARFKPEVVALSDYLERDLVSLWGYDRLS